jgi:hypothetical protein
MGCAFEGEGGDCARGQEEGQARSSGKEDVEIYFL